MSNLIKITTQTVTISLKNLLLAALLLLVSNFVIYKLLTAVSAETPRSKALKQRLYLLDQAATFVYDIDDFESKVRDVSKKLSIPPEWLMAVMHSESKFDASVGNRHGSGATGLIQFMPATAKDFNISVQQLKNLSHVEQLDFVYRYLDAKRNQYRDYESLTDLYLAILYPRALAQDYCYTLYAKPSDDYRMNSGLDQNKDGRVTVQDVDKYLQHLYPTAYVVTKNPDNPLLPSGNRRMVTGWGND